MGFGLPAAIGAYLAKPENLVLNITGDGSFQMNLQELATCREHHIPVKIIIMNNSYLGMVRQMQEKFYNNCYQVEMTNPDFTKIAEAYGHKTEEDSVKTYQAYGDELMSAGIPIDREELNKKGGDFASLLYTLKKVDE